MADNNNPGNQKPSLSWSQPAAPAAKPAAATSATPVTPAAKPAANASKTAAVESASNTAMYVGIFVVGLIVGALIGWGISASRNGASSTTASSTSMTSTSTTSMDLSGSAVGTAGSIQVTSPQQAGFAVTVSKISVSVPTWLAVYEDNNGMRGNALGAELFFPSLTGGTIELLRATLPGSSYFVGQNVDDGDKTFSVQNDKPVNDQNGNPLYTEFKAQ